ncbi:anti-sigma factor family protein [Microbispora bryophytorum]|uniref:anti-sigma factor family protein n=1 Tax=Microbispora bryophytorum TaxID=1460882 RepID=UPI0033C520F2
MTHPTHHLPAYAAGHLTADDAAAVTAHLAGCPACATQARAWHRTATAVQDDTARVAPPAPDLFTAIRRRLTTTPNPSGARPVPPYVPTYRGNLGTRPLHRALGILTRQRTLIRWPVWTLAAALIAGGAILAALAPTGHAAQILAMTVPLAAALAVAGTCGTDNDPPAELAATLPTPPRVVLLARLTLVLTATVTAGLLATLALSALTSGGGAAGLVTAWFGPLVPLSATSFALSVLYRPSAGVTTALALWLARALSTTGQTPATGLSPAVLRLVDPLWTPGPAVLTAAAALVAATLLLSPRLPRSRHTGHIWR